MSSENMPDLPATTSTEAPAANESVDTGDATETSDDSSELLDLIGDDDSEDDGEDDDDDDDESSSSEETKKEDDDKSEVFKVKIDGEIKELELSELKRLASLSGGAQKKMEEAANIRKEVAAKEAEFEQKIGLVQSFWNDLRDPGTTFHVLEQVLAPEGLEKAVRGYVQQRLEESRLDPRERALTQKEKELQRLEHEYQARLEAGRMAENASMLDQVQAYYEPMYGKAVKALRLPATAAVQRLMEMELSEMHDNLPQNELLDQKDFVIAARNVAKGLGMKIPSKKQRAASKTATKSQGKGDEDLTEYAKSLMSSLL